MCGAFLLRLSLVVTREKNTDFLPLYFNIILGSKDEKPPSGTLNMIGVVLELVAWLIVFSGVCWTLFDEGMACFQSIFCDFEDKRLHKTHRCIFVFGILNGFENAKWNVNEQCHSLRIIRFAYLPAMHPFDSATLIHKTSKVLTRRRSLAYAKGAMFFAWKDYQFRGCTYWGAGSPEAKPQSSLLGIANLKQ